MQYCGRPGTWHLREGTKDLNRNQKAAARQLSLAAYLLFSAGRAKDEASIAENLPPYGAVYDASLGEDGDREHAGDAVRKQLQRDVEAMGSALSAVSSRDARGYFEHRGYHLLDQPL